LSYNINVKYVSSFEPLVLRSRLHHMKDFHYLHKGLQTLILYINGGTKLMHKVNHLYTRGRAQN